MRFGSTAKTLAKRKLKYDRISEWIAAHAVSLIEAGCLALTHTLLVLPPHQAAHGTIRLPGHDEDGM